MSHTPGPWRVGRWLRRCTRDHVQHAGHSAAPGDECVFEQEFTENVEGLAAEQPGVNVLASSYDGFTAREDDLHLMKAAPSMLSALRAVDAWWDDVAPNTAPEFKALRAKVRAAIAEAVER
jgi:hypothetical protein